jgi:Cd2+/Zn2+-exporting ATPase
MITGESMPVDKTVDAAVFAGTINGEGQLTVEVSKLAKDSSLARMIRMVTEAQTQKSPTQSFVSRFEKVFVPLVLLGVLGLIVAPALMGMPFAASFYQAMAVLVAASPCALAIATPSAVLAGVARAARAGVLIKGGAHLENLGRLAAIAFDKTGAITSANRALPMWSFSTATRPFCSPQPPASKAAAATHWRRLWCGPPRRAGSPGRAQATSWP